MFVLGALCVRAANLSYYAVLEAGFAPYVDEMVNGTEEVAMPAESRRATCSEALRELGTDGDGRGRRLPVRPGEPRDEAASLQPAGVRPGRVRHGRRAPVPTGLEDR